MSVTTFFRRPEVGPRGNRTAMKVNRGLRNGNDRKDLVVHETLNRLAIKRHPLGDERVSENQGVICGHV